MTCIECGEREAWIKKHALCHTCYMKRYMRERRNSRKGNMAKRPKLSGLRLKERAMELLGGVCVLCNESNLSELQVKSSTYFGLRNRKLWLYVINRTDRAECFQLLCNRCIRRIQKER